MNWLTDLLKHLRISRSLIGAIFVTTVVLYFGRRVLLIEGIPKEWGPYLLAALLLSGCLILSWIWDAVWFKNTTFFHITPSEQFSGWSMAPLADQSLCLHLKAQVNVQNNTSMALYFPKAKLLRPKILRTVLHERILVEGSDGRMGSVDTGIGLSPVAFGKAIIEIAGTVKKEPPHQPMSVVFEVADAAGRRQRIKMQLQYVGSAEAAAAKTPT